MVSKKKLSIIVSIILLASLASVSALYYGTNIIPPLSSPPNTMSLKFVSSAMEPTIHEGNYVLVDKSVSPSELKTDYPISDIIVFRNPTAPEMGYIGSRIFNVTAVNGTLYFQTKGDANGDWDYWVGPLGVSQDLIVGKVIDTNYK